MGSRSHAMPQACYGGGHAAAVALSMGCTQVHMGPCAGWAVRRVARAVTMVAEAWYFRDSSSAVAMVRCTAQQMELEFMCDGRSCCGMQCERSAWITGSEPDHGKVL